jgi:hypothetical protein
MSAVSSTIAAVGALRARDRLPQTDVIAFGVGDLRVDAEGADRMRRNDDLRAGLGGLLRVGLAVLDFDDEDGGLAGAGVVALVEAAVDAAGLGGACFSSTSVVIAKL